MMPSWSGTKVWGQVPHLGFHPWAWELSAVRFGCGASGQGPSPALMLPHAQIPHEALRLSLVFLVAGLTLWLPKPQSEFASDCPGDTDLP